MKKLFSFVLLAVAVLVTGLVLKMVGKETRTKFAWAGIFSVPVALADVPGNTGGSGDSPDSPEGGSAEGGGPEGTGCEGGTCEGSSSAEGSAEGG